MCVCESCAGFFRSIAVGCTFPGVAGRLHGGGRVRGLGGRRGGRGGRGGCGAAGEAAAAGEEAVVTRRVAAERSMWRARLRVLREYQFYDITLLQTVKNFFLRIS